MRLMSLHCQRVIKRGRGRWNCVAYAATVLPLCCQSLTTGYFHLLEALPSLDKLPKPRLGETARVRFVLD
jgi:hypothetical protein